MWFLLMAGDVVHYGPVQFEDVRVGGMLVYVGRRETEIGIKVGRVLRKFTHGDVKLLYIKEDFSLKRAEKVSFAAVLGKAVFVHKGRRCFSADTLWFRCVSHCNAGVSFVLSIIFLGVLGRLAALLGRAAIWTALRLLRACARAFSRIPVRVKSTLPGEGLYGELERDAIWSGTIAVVGDYVVPEGRTLWMRPGTVVWFAPSSRWSYPEKADYFKASAERTMHRSLCALIVHGRLVAVGNPDEPVVLACSREWDGLLFAKRSRTSVLRHVILQGGCWTGVNCAEQSRALMESTVVKRVVPELLEAFPVTDERPPHELPDLDESDLVRSLYFIPRPLRRATRAVLETLGMVGPVKALLARALRR